MSDAIHLNWYGQQLNSDIPRALYEDYDDEAQQQRRKERLQRKKSERRQPNDVVEDEPDLDEILSEPKKVKKAKKAKKKRNFADVPFEEDVFDIELNGLVDDDLWHDDAGDDVL